MSPKVILLHPLFWAAFALSFVFPSIIKLADAPPIWSLLVAIALATFTPFAANMKAQHQDVAFPISACAFQGAVTFVTSLALALQSVIPIMQTSLVPVSYQVIALLSFLYALVTALGNQLKVEEADQPTPVENVASVPASTKAA